MWQALWGSLLATIYFYLRPMFKWILRRVTGKCELLRIIYQYPPGTQQTKYVESSLKKSSNVQLKRLAKESDTNIEAAIVLVMKLKCIVPEIHSMFEERFRRCLIQIKGYIQLQQQVEDLRKIRYSSDNEEHEKKLLQLWNILMPDEELPSRTGHHWSHLGFQGDDPQTDFRGMGQLGLDQLIYFATKYTKELRSMLSRSHNPKCGYSLAIVGINMTELVYTLLKSGNLRSHFYTLKAAPPSLEEYHQVYCFVFHEFDKFWFSENPKDIMEFGKVREKYRRKLVWEMKGQSRVLMGAFQQEKGL